MIINNISQFNKPYRANQVSFGKITPNHLFIKMPKYYKNRTWGKAISDYINSFSKELKKNPLSFDFVLSSLQRKYRESRLLHPVIGIGEIRNYEDKVHFRSKGKFSLYIPKARSYLATRYNSKTAKKYIVVNNGNPKKINISTLTSNHKSDMSKFSIELANPLSFNDLFACMKAKYNEIIALQDLPKNKQFLRKANGKIAELHWMFTNTMPYKRGSAGMADMFTKVLYESLGIQVSPWKKGIAPDLEAFVTNKRDYVKNYTKLFEKPPKIMKG